MAVFYIVFPYMLPWLKAVKKRRLMIHLLFWLQAVTFLSIASKLNWDCHHTIWREARHWNLGVEIPFVHCFVAAPQLQHGTSAYLRKCSEYILSLSQLRCETTHQVRDRHVLKAIFACSSMLCSTIHFECSQVMIGTFGANNFSVAYWTARAWPLSRIPVFGMGCLSAVERMHGGGVFRCVAGLSQLIADGRGLSFVVTPLCSDWITAVGVASASEIRDLEYHGVILKQLINITMENHHF